ncbi:DUF5008 domain-containing protein [Pedobacter nyackensis]|uniref:DUF5008 domain-containing protein n=1 Tax=Pedobacter nyackensis TaxID=475255 RepID=UPI00292CD3B8|nr:DUF5008 domain-containing protein [Pedobacter nyackensis]
MILNFRHKITQLFTCLTLLICSLTACKKDTYVGKDPYGDAKPQLDLKVNTLTASPVEGAIASTVTLSGSGFLKYKTDLKVQFNGEQAEILSVTDTEVKVKVPEWASSGLITYMVGAQILPGPKFRVTGTLQIDKTFNSYVGANDDIYSITALPDGRMIIAGNFTDYNNAGIRAGYSKLAIISSQGVLDKSYKPGKGFPSGHVYKSVVLQDGKILVGGNFNSFDTRNNQISNIAKISLTGGIDSTVYTYTDRSGEIKKSAAPTFKAFFNNAVDELLVQPDGNIIVSGSFKYYMTKTYYPNQKDTIITDSTQINYMARIKPDGSLDKTYNFNTQTNKANEGFNGFIYKSYMQADGKLIVAGGFSSYNGENVSKIVRLNLDGSLDKSFNPGTGPNGTISSIQPYLNGQMLISGEFLSYNGKNRTRVAIINENGSLDESFDPGVSANGSISRAIRLGNGKILLTGNFQKFNNINRFGLAVVEANGTLSPAYNTLGGFVFSSFIFRSPVNEIINVDNGEAAILVGSFNSLDLQQNTRLVKIKY